MNKSASKNPSIFDTKSERSLNLSFAEQPRQAYKTMTRDNEDSENKGQSAQERNLSTVAALAAQAAKLAAYQHRPSSENIQRIAEQTAHRFVDRDLDSTRP